MNSFLLRHTKGSTGNNSKSLYEEDTYINQQTSLSKRNLLNCYAYAESVWYGKYKFSFPKNPFPDNDHSDNDHSDQFWSFEIVIAGDGILKSNNMCYKVTAHDVLIMRPDVATTLQVGPSGFLRKKAIILKGSIVEYICKNSDLADVNYIPSNDSNDSSRLLNIYDNIKAIVINQDEYWQQDISSKSYDIINEFNRLATPHQYPLTLHNALNIIESNLSKDYTLEYLSLQCKTSIRTLFRLFKKYKKTSPINYIIEQRLEQVKVLLNISYMPIKEIAIRCGYKSSAFMSRAFKKKYGLSPAKFRNLNT